MDYSECPDSEIVLSPQLHGPTQPEPAACTRDGERLGRYPSEYDLAQSRTLTPEEMRQLDADSASLTKHSARLNDACAYAHRSDAAMLARRDAAIVSRLQDGIEEDYANLIASLLGEGSRYAMLKQAADIAFAIGPTQLPLALAASLVAVAAVVAPHTRIRAGRHSLPTTLLITAPAPSGSGKDAALGMLRGMLMETGREAIVTEKLASAQALEDAVATSGQVCLVLDEFGTPASGGPKSALLGTVIDYYSRSGKPAPVRKAAGQTKKPDRATVMLSGVLMGTPRNLLAELKPELMASGLANRLLMLPALSEDTARKLEAITESKQDAASAADMLTRDLANLIALAKFGASSCEHEAAASALGGPTSAAQSNLPGSFSHPPSRGGGIELYLEDTPEVESILAGVNSFQQMSKGNTCNPVYARFTASVYKVAAVLQRARCLLSDPLDAVVDARDLADAFELVTLSCAMMDRVSVASGGGIVGLAQDLWDWLQRQAGQCVTLSAFRTKNRRAPYRQEAEEWLLERRLIRLQPNPRGGGQCVATTNVEFPF